MLITTLETPLPKMPLPAGLVIVNPETTTPGASVIASPVDDARTGRAVLAPEQVAALIGRVDRRGRMLWSLPKGHIELGETAEQTAIREGAEETGIQGSVLAALGRIDYWFVTDGRRVHKTVHHYLMRCSGGELSDDDVEVAEVAWVPIPELPSRLAYADERSRARVGLATTAGMLRGLISLPYTIDLGQLPTA